MVWIVALATAGLLGSYALVGVMVGALLAGTVGDWLGRRKVMLASCVWFSGGMALTAMATTHEAFGWMRFAGPFSAHDLLPTVVLGSAMIGAGAALKAARQRGGCSVRANNRCKRSQWRSEAARSYTARCGNEKPCCTPGYQSRRYGTPEAFSPSSSSAT